jgi:hypothetical protein
VPSWLAHLAVPSFALLMAESHRSFFQQAFELDFNNRKGSAGLLYVPPLFNSLTPDFGAITVSTPA